MVWIHYWILYKLLIHLQVLSNSYFHCHLDGNGMDLLIALQSITNWNVNFRMNKNISISISHSVGSNIVNLTLTLTTSHPPCQTFYTDSVYVEFDSLLDWTRVTTQWSASYLSYSISYCTKKFLWKFPPILSNSSYADRNWLPVIKRHRKYETFFFRYPSICLFSFFLSFTSKWQNRSCKVWLNWTPIWTVG